MTGDNKKAKSDPAKKDAPAANKEGASGKEASKAAGRRNSHRGTFQLQPGRRPETGHCGLQGKLERDFRKEEHEQEKAIILEGNKQAACCEAYARRPLIRFVAARPCKADIRQHDEHVGFGQ